jgi:hypothetical protein
MRESVLDAQARLRSARLFIRHTATKTHLPRNHQLLMRGSKRPLSQIKFSPVKKNWRRLSINVYYDFSLDFY